MRRQVFFMWSFVFAAAGISAAPAEPAAIAETTPATAPEASGFDRYQVILDRQPFGSAADAGAETGAAVTAAAESFARTMRLCSLARIGDGPVRAGLVDTRNGRTLALELGGDAVEGIRLTDANLETWEATLQRDTEIVVMKLQAGAPSAPGRPGAPSLRGPFGAPSAAPSTAPATPSSAAAPAAPIAYVSGPPAAATANTGSANGRMSYAERRRRREEERMAALAQQQQATEAAAAAASTPPAGNAAEPAAAPERLTGEALQKHLQEYQMELIRTGQPPLPIALTPEMDAQLVREGVLPAQNAEGAAPPSPDAAAPAGPPAPDTPPAPPQ